MVYSNKSGKNDTEEIFVNNICTKLKQKSNTVSLEPRENVSGWAWSSVNIPNLLLLD